jgi:hypothetical protein
MDTAEAKERLNRLETAIIRHREEKATVPDCTCWVTHSQKMDAELYACLEQSGTPEFRIAQLEEAIRLNRHGKRKVPDCPCWGNAPQIVDAELYSVLDEAKKTEK